MIGAISKVLVADPLADAALADAPDVLERAIRAPMPPLAPHFAGERAFLATDELVARAVVLTGAHEAVTHEGARNELDRDPSSPARSRYVGRRRGSGGASSSHRSRFFSSPSRWCAELLADGRVR